MMTDNVMFPEHHAPSQEKRKLQEALHQQLADAVTAGMDPETAADAVFGLALTHLQIHLTNRQLSRLLDDLAQRFCAHADVEEGLMRRPGGLH